MDSSEELKKWVESLTTAEKRFVKLQGKARAGSGSQLLDLFDWLNTSQAGDAVPAHAKFANNLPTLAIRLRELMLDSLRLLHKEDDLDAMLRAMIDEIAVLESKKLHHVSVRQLRKLKKMANESSRYPFLFLCFEKEFQSVHKLPPEKSEGRLRQLREEELDAFSKHQALRELHFRHNEILSVKNQFPFSRNPKIVKQINDLADAPVVKQCGKNSPYLENALAVNILGIRDLYNHKPDDAVIRYRQLLHEWQLHPKWQADQPALLLNICKQYQNVCFLSPVEQEQTRADLAFLHNFNGLPKEESLSFHEMLHHNQFLLALNTGRFDAVKPMIAEIDQWMQEKGALLSENQVLPFLCNFTVAEFLSGDFESAKKFITRILNRPNQKVRVDIREFALVLQTVLHYQLNNSSLNEYLTRAGKRHFSKNTIAIDFEMVVFRHIELLMRANTKKEKETIFNQLSQALENLSKTLPDSIPLLGLNEIFMWAESCSTGIPLEDVFIRRVKENLRMLEQQEKLS
jgi:hypothetical protein